MAHAAICPVCLQRTRERAAIVLQRTAAAKRAREAARMGCKQRLPGTGHAGREAAGAGGEPVCLDYMLPPLEEVLRMTHGQRRPAERAVSHIYLWGYEPLQSPLVRNQAKPTAEARAFAAAHGWEAGRTGAWAVDLVLPLPLSEALGELEPTLRDERAVTGWGGRTGCEPRSVPGWLPLPPDPVAAAADHRRSARALCQRAQTISIATAAAMARQQQLRRQVRDQRLVRLKRLPPAEFDAVNRTVTAAIELGKAGQFAAGYTLLLTSWEQAAAAVEQRLPWSSARRWIYTLALENYLWRYGPSLP